MNSLKSECVVACVLRGYVEDTTVALDDCTTLNGVSIRLYGAARGCTLVAAQPPCIAVARMRACVMCVCDAWE